MRKFFKLSFLAAVLTLVAVPARAQMAVAAYVLEDHATGYILESYKGDQKRPIASLTKIATTKIVLDWAQRTNTDLSQQVIVPVQAMGPGLTSPVGLVPNDLASYRDLIYAALLQSDNIAASTLAFYVGSALRAQGGPELRDLAAIDAFVAQMNALARELGMERTLFVNPHGLEPPRGLQPYSTALDLGKLTIYAMRDAAFRFYVSQRERKVAVTRNGQVLQFVLRNTNELVGTAGVDGVKTGTTAKAGNCLILSSQHDPEVKQQGATTLVTPRRVNVVVLSAADRFGTGSQLLARAWLLYDQWAAAGRPAAQPSPR
ncbi:MAG: D-alanyl-D-alanine carboxypeptidase [Verrucomicrobia bacterium]|nr:D-alanyl-D-alanine carboxypeptidase [Verrucomicrobiota bacterium]